MGDNCEHGNDVRYGCKHCDDAGTEPPLARGRMTDLPDAETAWENYGGELMPEQQTDDVWRAFLAGFAAASGPWAEQLDTAKPCAVCKEWETQYDAAMEQIERLQNRILKAEPRPNQPIDDFGGNIRSMYVRVSDGWLRRFDKWRKAKGLSRSGAIRKLVQDAWEADNAR